MKQWKWMVILIRGGKRITKEFIDVSNKCCKEEAREFYRKAKKRFKNDDEVEVHLISCTKAYPPKEGDEIKLRSGKLWCPYCRKVRRFKGGAKTGYTCPVCGVTDNDFYVKKFNGLWPKISKKGD